MAGNAPSWDRKGVPKWTLRDQWSIDRSPLIYTAVVSRMVRTKCGLCSGFIEFFIKKIYSGGKYWRLTVGGSAGMFEISIDPFEVFSVCFSVSGIYFFQFLYVLSTNVFTTVLFLCECLICVNVMANYGQYNMRSYWYFIFVYINYNLFHEIFIIE